jgi:SAM-dependent methyltransferase
MLDTQLSGPWLPEMYEEHLPDSRAVDQGLMESLIQTYKPLKSLDLGCGLGYFVAYLREQGVDAWGVEAEDLGDVFKSPGHQIRKDLSQSFDLQERYDLVICLEVVEHIPRDFEDNVFDNIVRHMSRYLLFSGATVGQQGTGHINERPESHWFSHLVRRGLVLRHQESLNIRLASTLPWYRNNVSLWELAHPDVNHSSDMIAERDSRIISYEQKLNYQFQQLQEQYDQLQAELNQKQTELNQAAEKLITFQYSRFWKLHQTWLRLEKAWKMFVRQ